MQGQPEHQHREERAGRCVLEQQADQRVGDNRRCRGDKHRMLGLQIPTSSNSFLWNKGLNSTLEGGGLEGLLNGFNRGSVYKLVMGVRVI